MVPLNLTYLHCLLHSFFERLFNLYLDRKVPSVDIYLLIVYTDTNVSSTLMMFPGWYTTCLMTINELWRVFNQIRTIYWTRTQYHKDFQIKLMKGTALRQHSLHEKKLPRFYWSWSSMVMKDTTALTPPAHERNCFAHQSHTLHDSWGKKNITTHWCSTERYFTAATRALNIMMILVPSEHLTNGTLIINEWYHDCIWIMVVIIYYISVKGTRSHNFRLVSTYLQI